MMMSWAHGPAIELPLFALAVIGTHLALSLGQTLMHRYLGHHRFGRGLYRNHMRFHHARYARDHLTSPMPEESEGNNTPYFLIPTAAVGALLYFLLPLGFFLAVMLSAAVSFYAHVQVDKAYHLEGSYLERFAWFRRMRQAHFEHHLHANSNFAVIDFYWDRLLGSWRDAGRR